MITQISWIMLSSVLQNMFSSSWGYLCGEGDGFLNKHICQHQGEGNMRRIFFRGLGLTAVILGPNDNSNFVYNVLTVLQNMVSSSGGNQCGDVGGSLKKQVWLVQGEGNMRRILFRGFWAYCSYL